AAEPKPAATVVLVRDGEGGPELLLLKRHHSSGFVPGAYVFPGGRVDAADGDLELLRLLGPLPRGPDGPYWAGAIREVFEETGVLLARSSEGTWSGDAASDATLAACRHRLLDDDATLLDVLRDADLRPDVSRMVYCSHWITPVAEPRRYDTRFFIAELPPGRSVTIDEREMSDAGWVTAEAALDGFRRGRLPMVFPTVKTVQLLAPYTSTDAMLAAFREADVEPVLPRLVRTSEGVGIVVPEDEVE